MYGVLRAASPVQLFGPGSWDAVPARVGRGRDVQGEAKGAA